MKGIKLFFLGVVLAMLVFSTFWAGNVYAATGCFTDTNGHWAETFICWMKDNGITGGTGGGNYSPNSYVTRGEMAVFMQRLAEIPPSTGDIYINAGLNDWVKNGSSNHHITYYSNVIYLQAPAAGTYGFQITPDLPATLYGRQMKTHSVKLCYDATHGAALTSVAFRHYLGGAASSIYREIEDTTSRTDEACRVYTFPADGLLWGYDHVVLYVTVNFPVGTEFIEIGATTFTLVPSAGAGVLSQDDTNDFRAEPQSLELIPGEAEAAP